MSTPIKDLTPGDHVVAVVITKKWDGTKTKCWGIVTRGRANRLTVLATETALGMPALITYPLKLDGSLGKCKANGRSADCDAFKVTVAKREGVVPVIEVTR